MISLYRLLSAVIGVAQKGAHVASIIRSDTGLLELLVQEKRNERNTRFVQDFKTLADVIIQEMVRHDLSEEFAGIESRIYGEESSTFTNTLGETVVVKLKKSVEETKSLLCDILNGNSAAASLLAEAVHSNIPVPVETKIDCVTGEIPLTDVCIWIDPIDSTAQYIHGQIGNHNEFGVVDEGLQCVTILIGAYSQTTGLPLLGVIVQPFAHYNDKSKSWESVTNWGVCTEKIGFSSFDKQKIPRQIPTLIMSTSDTGEVYQKLSSEFNIQYAPGAGYKLLCVANGIVDAYVLSKSSIYSWDCCSPHAVLLALGGGMIAYNSIISGSIEQVKYHQKTSAIKGNSISGIVAYRSPEILDKVVKCLKS